LLLVLVALMQITMLGLAVPQVLALLRLLVVAVVVAISHRPRPLLVDQVVVVVAQTQLPAQVTLAAIHLLRVLLVVLVTVLLVVVVVVVLLLLALLVE
jgi:hypothetical protein